MTWYETENGNMLNLDLVRYTTEMHIGDRSFHAVVFDEMFAANDYMSGVELSYFELTDKDYENIKNILLNK